jgi:hypothetical protein
VFSIARILLAVAPASNRSARLFCSARSIFNMTVWRPLFGPKALIHHKARCPWRQNLKSFQEFDQRILIVRLQILKLRSGVERLACVGEDRLP